MDKQFWTLFLFNFTFLHPLLLFSVLRVFFSYYIENVFWLQEMQSVTNCFHLINCKKTYLKSSLSYLYLCRITWASSGTCQKVGREATSWPELLTKRALQDQWGRNSWIIRHPLSVFLFRESTTQIDCFLYDHVYAQDVKNWVDDFFTCIVTFNIPNDSLPLRTVCVQVNKLIIYNFYRAFQQMAGLRPTGTLDKNTVRMMAMPRCGVEDTIGATNMGSNGESKGLEWLTSL